ASVLAAGGEAVARLTRRPPPLARGQLHYLRWNAIPDATRARTELGWEPTSLAEGLRRTLAELDRA
ncbi:dihydroflavonol 4-reductase, partial [Frankia sp. AiPs1]|nr:dihydroflavonol 4-reductase [Frankia sp. AiPs1]